MTDINKTQPGQLLLRQISEQTFTTYLGDVEYMRVDVLNDLERVRRQHIEKARRCNFSDCGCEYCEALSPLMPLPEALTSEATNQ